MKYALCFLSLALLLSCNELSFPNSAALPIVEVLEATDIDSTGVTLNAYVPHLGTQRIVRSSFNWYPRNTDAFLEEERYLAEVALKESKEVSARIARDLVPGEIYEARIIIELEGEKIYSNTVEFTSLGAIQQPIRLENSSEELSLSTSSIAVWGLNNIYIGTGSNLYSYAVPQSQWLKFGQEVNGVLFSNCFYADDQRMYFAGTTTYSSPDPIGLWYLDRLDGDFVRVGDFPQRRSRIRFSFAIGNRIYTNRAAGTLGYFELENYQGLIDLGPLPFRTDAYQYYTFEVAGKAFVFFSDPQKVTNPPQYSHQLWMYDPTSSTWTKRSTYPGAGKDFFVTSTDGERYLFVGMGAVGRDPERSHTNTFALKRDIWRYDMLEDTWDFIGWSPVNVTKVPSINPRIKDGKHFLVMAGLGSVHIVSISQDQISPL